VTVVGLHEVVVMTAEVPLTDPYTLLLVGVTVSPAPLTEEEEYELLLLVG